MILSYFQLYTCSLRVKNNTKLFINKDVIVLGFSDITYDLKKFIPRRTTNNASGSSKCRPTSIHITYI